MFTILGRCPRCHGNVCQGGDEPDEIKCLQCGRTPANYLVHPLGIPEEYLNQLESRRSRKADLSQAKAKR